MRDFDVQQIQEYRFFVQMPSAPQMVRLDGGVYDICSRTRVGRIRR
jgi:hypothetical protein